MDKGVDLSVKISGVTLKNPIMPASGTFEYREEDAHMISPSVLGAVVNKTIFPEKRLGNLPPRVIETPCGMLNAVGIPSEGADFFIKDTLPKMASYGVPVIVSIAGNNIDEFSSLAERIEQTGLCNMIELNLSCPNLSHEIEWARDERLLSQIIKAVRAKINLPIIAKLSPMVTDVGHNAKIAEESGADVVSLINTFKGIHIDVATKKPSLNNVTGGLSGPAIHPLAVYSVYTVYNAVSIPIIGMGGVNSWDAALQLILAGATAVGVGMYNFVDPWVMSKIIEGLSSYIEKGNCASIRELVGHAHSNY